MACCVSYDQWFNSFFILLFVIIFYALFGKFISLGIDNIIIFSTYGNNLILSTSIQIT